jgi:hypothetical protein
MLSKTFYIPMSAPSFAFCRPIFEGKKMKMISEGITLIPSFVEIVQPQLYTQTQCTLSHKVIIPLLNFPESKCSIVSQDMFIYLSRIKGKGIDLIGKIVTVNKRSSV